MDISVFRQLPILGIIRGIDLQGIEELIDTVVACGLKTIEITMNTPGAPGFIKKALERARGRLTVGAGTVLCAGELKQALDAGASFIVSPACVEDVVSACVRQKIPVFPGALTPQEVYAAWRAGASMVKVFPSNSFGPGYFRELQGPFPDIPLLACGGVTPDNLAEYFNAGATAVSFGSSVFRKEWLAAGEFHRIGERIKAYVSHYRAFRNV